MARHVDRIKPQPARPSRKEPDQIAPDMPRRPQHQRQLPGAELLVPLPQQGLLQLLGLDQVAVERVVDPLQLVQRFGDQIVLLLELGLHVKNAFARLHAGAQFVGVHRLGQEIVGPAVEPARHLSLLALGGQQDEIAVPVAANLPEGLAEFQTGHARHHPVAEHHVGQLRSGKLHRLLARGRLDHVIAPAMQRGRQDLALQLAVIDHQHPGRDRRHGQRFTGLTANLERPGHSGINTTTISTVSRAAALTADEA